MSKLRLTITVEYDELGGPVDMPTSINKALDELFCPKSFPPGTGQTLDEGLSWQINGMDLFAEVEEVIEH
jgi:hypothetical protein